MSKREYDYRTDESPKDKELITFYIPRGAFETYKTLRNKYPKAPIIENIVRAIEKEIRAWEEHAPEKDKAG